MKKEDIKRVKIMYSDVSKNGIFYYGYNEDVFVVSYIMGYKVKNNKVGFPVNSLEKVISVFSKMKVDIYLDDMSFEFGNNFKKYLDEYKSIKEIFKRDKDSTLDEARTNTNDSTIKAYIDNWYENNFTSYN